MRAAATGAGLALAAMLAGCATANLQVTGSEPVDARYSVSGGSFSTGGSLVVMLRPFERDGRAGVCGAYTWTRQSAVSLVQDNFIENAGSVGIDGVRLFDGVTAFPSYEPREDMRGLRATCVLTDTPWRPEFEDARARARFPRVAFPDDSISGVLTVFRPGDVPDLVGGE